jgi:hypothetical protein
MPLPTFIVAGAQKGGTTTLHNMLGQHPQIHVSRPKELHYFDRHYRNGLDWYSAAFQPTSEHRAWGEATPIYMYEPLARRRMCRDLPEVRLVIILRDPVARAYSNYWMNRSKGVEDIDTFEAAIDLEDERRKAGTRRVAARYAYLDRGLYADQLEALEVAHGRELIHPLLLSDLTADPTTALSGVFAFLEVDAEPAAEIPLLHAKSFKGQDKSKGKTTSVSAGSYPPIQPATEERLRSHFAEPNRRLAAGLGRDLTACNHATAPH